MTFSGFLKFDIASVCLVLKVRPSPEIIYPRNLICFLRNWHLSMLSSKPYFLNIINTSFNIDRLSSTDSDGMRIVYIHKDLVFSDERP